MDFYYPAKFENTAVTGSWYIWSIAPDTEEKNKRIWKVKTKDLHLHADLMTHTRRYGKYDCRA